MQFDFLSVPFSVFLTKGKLNNLYGSVPQPIEGVSLASADPIGSLGKSFYGGF